MNMNAEFVKKIPNPTAKPPKYNPNQLWQKFVEYVEWCDDNPLKAERLFCAQGDIVRGVEDRLQAWTEMGFCLFAGISREVFRRYKTGEVGKRYGVKYKEIALKIADSIYQQKLLGASADMLNANIISRELGLADKKQIEANINLSDATIEFE